MDKNEYYEPKQLEMKILFSLPYRASFGEELVLNILEDGETSAANRYQMTTTDGMEWHLTLNLSVHSSPYIDYYYSVNRNGVEHRHEWLVQPHRLVFPTTASVICTVNDRWIDIPEDAPLYSAPFARTEECEASAAKVAEGTEKLAGALLVLKVRAPRLRFDERLVMCGSAPELGAWDVAHALPMQQVQPHEWLAVVDLSGMSVPAIEYKFVALGHEGNRSPLWEEGANRSMPVPVSQSAQVVVHELEDAWFSVGAWRAAGTVIPVFSLRSEGSFGVGDFGDLKQFVDWVAMTGQRVLQVLPIYDTTITRTWQDSYPYNSISIYALHPQYTDLRQLPPLADADRAAHYETLRMELNALPQIDYERVNEAKEQYLRELFRQEWGNVSRRSTYKKFFEANKAWLEPYARYSVLRDRYGTANFNQWPAEAGNGSDIAPKELAYWYFVQYHLDAQLSAAHSYAKSRRVVLKGDIPIGISRDGVEAWVEPRYFNLNGQAGAPPDAFSANGQNWGFPTYNWDAMIADGCKWWVKRFRKMAEYFDAYRIDHVLGFFRIWEIPIEAVHGLLGHFVPALSMSADEIRSYGFRFDEQRHTQPCIQQWMLQEMFGERAEYVTEHFLDSKGNGEYQLKPEYDTQRKIEQAYKNAAASATQNNGSGVAMDADMRDALYALVSEVLFVADHKNPQMYHPRIAAQLDFVYRTLSEGDKTAFNRLYNEYFYQRNNMFWYGEAMKKLPRLTECTRMLVCAEDLGMVPQSVSWVMNELRILSLEIQSMPKDDQVRFGYLERNPYRSVCTISTHDMSTLRQWWDEDTERAQTYYNTMLCREGEAPHPMPSWLARDIVARHLASPSMLCLLSFQDWMAISEEMRLPDAQAERINIPANPRHYWRYRMHLTIEQLVASTAFNEDMRGMITCCGR